MRMPSRLILAAVLACPFVVAAQGNAPAQSTSPATASPAVSPPSPTPMTPAPPSAATPAVAPSPMSAPDPVQAEFDALDRDGDGRVSSSEHAAGAKARFDAMDNDNNYKVGASEMAAGTSDQSVSAQIAGTQRGDRPVDANANGEISPEESRLEAEAAFRSRDVNGDGNLSAEEMRAGSGVPATRP